MKFCAWLVPDNSPIRFCKYPCEGRANYKAEVVSSDEGGHYCRLAWSSLYTTYCLPLRNK